MTAIRIKKLLQKNVDGENDVGSSGSSDMPQGLAILMVMIVGLAYIWGQGRIQGISDGAMVPPADFLFVAMKNECVGPPQNKVGEI